MSIPNRLTTSLTNFDLTYICLIVSEELRSEITQDACMCEAQIMFQKKVHLTIQELSRKHILFTCNTFLIKKKQNKKSAIIYYIFCIFLGSCCNIYSQTTVWPGVGHCYVEALFPYLSVHLMNFQTKWV